MAIFVTCNESNAVATVSRIDHPMRLDRVRSAAMLGTACIPVRWTKLAKAFDGPWGIESIIVKSARRNKRSRGRTRTRKGASQGWSMKVEVRASQPPASD